MNNKILPESQDSLITKPRKLTNKKKLAVLGTCLILLCITVVVALYYSLNSNQIVIESSDEDCAKGHEQYQLESPSILGKYLNAAVATDSVPCATVGKQILLENGSAVDAAIATGLCNGLFNPQSMGIGGGHFMLIYLREKKSVIAIDAREVAPLRSTEDMFVNNTDQSLQGGKASGIPGEISGYWIAHQLAGKLPWKRLFEPAISYARNGIKVSSVLGSSIKSNEQNIRNNSGLADIFIEKATGQIYKENDTLKMPKLANTLEIISEKGASAFYDGELSETIVKENNMNGGIFSLEDLKKYNASIRNALNVSLNNKYRAFAMPAPSSGLLVTFSLNVMSQYELKPDIYNDKQKLATLYHQLTEVFKHGFAKRSYFGDSNFIDMTALTRNLTSPDYVKEIVNKIDNTKTFPEEYYGPGWSGKSDSGTAHISILAPNGDAVGLTCTVNTFFGAKYAGETTGIIYNNEMDDFSTPGTINYFGVPSSEANFIRPGKKPMSSMTPTIIVDEFDNVRLVVGASGGTKIISAVTLVAMKNLWLGKNVKEATDESRLHHQLSPPYIEIERGFPSDLQEMLQKKGHKTQCFNYGGSIVQAIERRSNGEIWANSDARKGGKTDGY